jgi:hypothetical protein
LAISVPLIAHADFFYDGNKLQQLAEADDRFQNGTDVGGDSYKSGSLIGYIVGVVDTSDNVLFCTPDNVKIGQLIDIVKKYLRDNPEKRHRPASDLVIDSLSSVFPCKR